MDIRLSDDKPYHSVGKTALLTTGAEPVSIAAPDSGIYAINTTDMDETHLLVFKIGDTALEAEDFNPPSSTFQDKVFVRSQCDLRPVYLKKGQFLGVMDRGASAVIRVALTLIHQFEAAGLVG